MSENLTIFKASAGSGKTHTLSEEYIRYLLDYKGNKDESGESERDIERANLDDYKKVLAVTFTNEATREMKSRILEFLKNLPDSFFENLLKGEQISEQEKDRLRKRAAKLLTIIVHDYSMFRVSTIDSFFQSILRAFSFEFGKDSSYELTIDQKEVVEESVKNLYRTIEQKTNLKDVILNIAKEQNENGKGWDFRNNILEFCKKISSEEFLNLKRNEPELFSKNDDGTSLLKQLIEAEEKMKKFVSQTLERVWSDYERLGEIWERYKNDFNLNSSHFNGMTKSLFYNTLEEALEYHNTKTDKRRVPSKSLPLSSKFLDLCSDQDYELCHRKNIKDRVIIDVMHRMYEEIKDLMIGDGGVGSYQGYLNEVAKGEEFSREEKFYSYRLILQNIQKIYLLSHINTSLENYCREEGIALLSESSNLIKSLISGSPTPFIYEKVGTRTDHFLLDEFQDTSSVQWDNFRPLLKESLDANRANLIVGDVKQSIYRWRGGDWNILNTRIESEFRNPTIIGDGETEGERENGKNINFRSLPNIIEFNNGLFSSLSPNSIPSAFKRLESLSDSQKDDLYKIYKGAQQITCDKSKKCEQKGYIEVITNEQGSNRVQKNYHRDSVVKYQVLEIINRLCNEKGYKRGAITILVSTNAQGADLVDFLMGKGVNVISSESLAIDSSKSVFTILTILEWLSNREKIERKGVNVKDKEGERERNVGIKLLKRLRNIEILNQDDLDKISLRESIFDICQRIIEFHLPKEFQSDSLFLSHFMDKVLIYSYSNGSDVSSFLKWWSANRESFSVQTPTNRDAVRIMTVHKAKGLAFDVVIVPFLRDVPSSLSILDRSSHFVKKEDESLYPFPALVSFSKDKINGTFYKSEYSKEYFNTIIDNINLAYVALTRAREKLYLFVNTPTKERKEVELDDSIATKIIDYCKAEYGQRSKEALSISLSEEIVSERFKGLELSNPDAIQYEYITYTFGNEENSLICKKEGEKPKVAEKNSVAKELKLFEVAKSRDITKMLRIRDFGEEDDIRHKGILYHQLYSYLNDCSMEEAVDKLIRANPSYTLISKKRDDIVREVNESLEQVKQYQWFNDAKYKVLSEQEIIYNGNFYRPDRILVPKDGSMDEAMVIDYKFGESESLSYLKQVSRYSWLLKQIGYKEVRGYIWYISLKKVVEV